MNPKTKATIAAMTVYQLLREHRFAAAGDLRYQGEEGKYRIQRLAQLRDQDPPAYVAASKAIGWGR